VSRPHIVAAADRAALRDLELLARTTVDGLRQGLHRSPFHGYSAEFSQYRHYRPGDDLKYVDWKAFARSDRLYSRQFRETTNLGALFVIDVSGSMGFPIGGASAFAEAPADEKAPPLHASNSTFDGDFAPDRSGGASAPPMPGPTRGGRAWDPAPARTKLTLAAATAAALGTLLIDQGDAAGLLAIPAEGRAEYLPARSGRHHLRLFLASLARLTAAGIVPVAQSLRRAATLMRRRGLVVVLSDLYDEDATLTEVRRLSRMGHDVIVFQTLAPEEVRLPAGGAVQFEDLETGARVIAEPESVRDHYEHAVHAFLSNIERTLRREGVDYVRLFTGEPIEPSLRRFLLSRRGRR